MIDNKEKYPSSEKNYKSKYYNIDASCESSAKEMGWEKEDFVWALKILESLPKEKLIEICQDPKVQLRFTDDSDWKVVDKKISLLL